MLCMDIGKIVLLAAERSFYKQCLEKKHFVYILYKQVFNIQFPCYVSSYCLITIFPTRNPHSRPYRHVNRLDGSIYKVYLQLKFTSTSKQTLTRTSCPARGGHITVSQFRIYMSSLKFFRLTIFHKFFVTNFNRLFLEEF